MTSTAVLSSSCGARAYLESEKPWPDRGQTPIGQSRSILVFRGIIEKDDGDNKCITRYTLNFLFRMYQDIASYLDPATASNIVNDPMPVMRTFTDFFRAADFSVKAFQNRKLKQKFLSCKALCRIGWTRAVPDQKDPSR